MGPKAATSIKRSLAFPRTNGVASLNAFEIVHSGYDAIAHEFADGGNPRHLPTTALVHAAPAGIYWGNHGYLHMFNRGLCFFSVGSAIESLIEFAGLVLPIPLPDVGHEPTPRAKDLEERWRKQRESTSSRWTEGMLDGDSFRFCYTDVVETAICLTRKPGILRVLTLPQAYVRVTCEDSNGNCETFSTIFKGEDVPLYLMQRRLYAEVHHFIDEVYERQLDWRPAVETARATVANKYGDAWRKKHRREAFADADAALTQLEEGFDRAAAIGEALQRLAPALPAYRRAHPMLAGMIDNFELTAAGTRPYKSPIRPYAVDAALLRPTGADL